MMGSGVRFPLAAPVISIISIPYRPSGAVAAASSADYQSIQATIKAPSQLISTAKPIFRIALQSNIGHPAT
jgi:hypothetical protein